MPTTQAALVLEALTPRAARSGGSSPHVPSSPQCSKPLLALCSELREATG